MSRERDKFRKYESGYEKQKKKEKREKFLKSQKGALDKFLKQDEDELQDEGSAAAAEGLSIVGKKTEILVDRSIPSTSNDKELSIFLSPDLSDNPSASNSDDPEKRSILTGELVFNVNNPSVPGSQNLPIPIEPEGLVFDFDINDPGTWPVLLPTDKFDEIIQKGPLQVTNFNFPKNSENRHFSSKFYKRVMSNGEEVHRQWLVYSKTSNKAFCFCCKLFGNTTGTQLACQGYSDWAHLGRGLETHETSPKHGENVKKWKECEMRLNRALTIDMKHRELINKEREHWREVLKRIVNVVKYLAEHNIAFRGSSSKLYERNNGNFLGLIEMLATFDPVIQEHVRRIRSSEIHDHYLGPSTQNELIKLLSVKVKAKNVTDIKAAKYFSVMLDCTPDLSHKEQLSLVIRFVKIDINASSNENEGVSIEEHFLGFLDVKSTTGEYLTHVLLQELDEIGLQIKDCRGQGYDNGSNMKGIYSGVQARILEINPRAFYMPCASHSLNLLICDAAKCSPKTMTFFGVVQRIYVLFSASTMRWEILMKHLPNMTVKRSCDTRWESKLESVKALRYQIKEVHTALVELVEVTEDPKANSEARSVMTEISSYEFLLALSIWYDVLFAVNSVSKNLQAQKMHLGVASQLLQGLVKFFEKFRVEGFVGATLVARELSETLNVEPTFKEVRPRKKRRLFEYEGEDSNANMSGKSAEEIFKVEYFFVIVDTVAQSLQRRFEQLSRFDSMFGFLYNVKEFKTIKEDKLFQKCKDLELFLSLEEEKDVCGNELFSELKILRELLPAKVETAAGILRFIKEIQNPFPNAFIAYRILLTIPVTVASAERSFSRLKLIKTYLRSSMAQERLSSLATLSIESDTTAKINFDDVIDDFAGMKARKVQFS